MKTHALALVLLFIIAACAQPTPQAPVEQAVQPEPSVEEIVTPPEPQTDILERANPQIEQLTARAGEVKGYTFALARLPKKSAENKYWVHGSKAKIELSSILAMDGWSADYVYLDYEKRSAFAYCIELSGCKKDKRSGGVPFEEYVFTLPPEWIDAALYGERGGQAQFFNRPVTEVTWQDADGKYYNAYLDNYYGFPLRVAIATDEDMANIIGGFEYQQIAFTTTAADVTPPY